jgi:hypothetical protein
MLKIIVHVFFVFFQQYGKAGLVTRGLSFVQGKRFIILCGFLGLMVTAGLSGCASTHSQEIIVSLPMCTPVSPVVNVYRAAPQTWANAIFEYAFPPIPTPISPNPPLQFNEQQILGARYAALQQLISETKRWSDTKIIKLNDSSEARITVTYISPELLQAVFLNEVLKDHFLTSGFQDQLQSVLNAVAERDELLFMLTVTMTNANNPSLIRHTIKIPIQEMVMHNAENLTIIHNHDDHNLEQIIDTSSNPVFGYLGYPLAVQTSQCKGVLDPRYNTNIVITIPYLEVDGASNKTPYFWTVPYSPLLKINLPPGVPNFILPPGFDTNLMTPLPLPPNDINQASYWQDFARFVWNQLTLGNY